MMNQLIEIPNSTFYQSTTAGNCEKIYNSLEMVNWAPWLRFTPDELLLQSTVFPEGQIMITDDRCAPVAYLSTTRTNWDGQPGSLTTWSHMCGSSNTFREAYVEDGNTLVFMSSGIRPDMKGKGIVKELVRCAIGLAENLSLPYIIGDFRPVHYGQYKRKIFEQDNRVPSFGEYCNLTDGYGKPQDPWLRALSYFKMRPLMVDHRAIKIVMSYAQFYKYRSDYCPELWFRIEPGFPLEQAFHNHFPNRELNRVDEIWECGETGTWYIDKGSDRAVYIETNLWGQVK